MPSLYNIVVSMFAIIVINFSGELISIGDSGHSNALCLLGVYMNGFASGFNCGCV